MDKCSYLKLVGYIEGLIDPEERLLLEEHVKNCPECLSQMQKIWNFQRIMSDVQVKESFVTPEFMKEKAKRLVPGKTKPSKILKKLLGKLVFTDSLQESEGLLRESPQITIRKSTHNLYETGSNFVSVKITRCRMDETLNIMGQIFPEGTDTPCLQVHVELYSDGKLTDRVDPDIFGRFRFYKLPAKNCDLRLVSDETEGFICLDLT